MSLKWKITLYVVLVLAVIGLIYFAGWKLSAIFGGAGLAGMKMLQKKNDKQAKEEEKVAQEVNNNKKEREEIAKELEAERKELEEKSEDRQKDIDNRQEKAETLEERLNSHLEGDDN